MRPGKLFILLLTAGLIAGGIYFFSQEDTFEELAAEAIEEYEGGDYIDAIEELSVLIEKASPRQGEKLHYYRSMAVKKLAEEQNLEFKDELKELSTVPKGKPRYKEIIKEIKEELDVLAQKTGEEFNIITENNTAFISPAGGFYEKFVSKYRGSSYLEDLDFETLKETRERKPEAFLVAVTSFYQKYPRTHYLSRIVSMLFKTLQKNSLSLAGGEKPLMDLLLAYGKKYPAGPELHRIYRCVNDNVNLRSTPGLDGKIVGKIRKDSILIQLKKSMDAMQIGSHRAYWYKISDLKGLRGWIFGRFLEKIDLAARAKDSGHSQWPIYEDFNKWSNSDTPEGWTHIAGASPGSIGFSGGENDRTVFIKSPQGSTAGLYKSHGASRAFTAEAEARFTGGTSVMIMAYSTGEKTFYVRLDENTIDTCGRKIPYTPSQWHIYRIESEDGHFAKLSADGELLAGRIEGKKVTGLTQRGLYCLVSLKDDASKAEIKYIKAR